MKKRNRLIMLFVVAIICCFLTAQSQIYVNIRPEIPRYERIEAPSPAHVWIEEDWEPRGGTYVFIGGHWASPPRYGMIWVPGFWKQHHRGWYWIPGRWRRMEGRRHERY